MPLRAAYDVIAIGVSASLSATGLAFGVAGPSPTIITESSLVPLGVGLTCLGVAVVSAYRFGRWKLEQERDKQDILKRLRRLESTLNRLAGHHSVEDS